MTATRGEHGWRSSEADYPGPAALGRTRETELRSAAQVMGLRKDLAAYQVAFGDLVMHVDGVERRAIGWPAWAINHAIIHSDIPRY